MATSIVLYDRLGRAFLFLPLAWALERFLNTLWHLWRASAFTAGQRPLGHED